MEISLFYWNFVTLWNFCYFMTIPLLYENFIIVWKFHYCMEILTLMEISFLYGNFVNLWKSRYFIKKFEILLYFWNLIIVLQLLSHRYFATFHNLFWNFIVYWNFIILLKLHYTIEISLLHWNFIILLKFHNFIEISLFDISLSHRNYIT